MSKDIITNDKNYNENKFDFKNQQYLCFYDSEFNAYDSYKDKKYPQEVIAIGFCIEDQMGNCIDKYYSLIKLKSAPSITKRTTELTGITNNEVKKGNDFKNVIFDVSSILQKYKIKTIFTYGSQDKLALEKTAQLYNYGKKVRSFSSKFVDIREYFKVITKGKVGDQGLSFLKKICELPGDVAHDALIDALDLADVYYVLTNKKYNTKIYKELTIEREEISCYKKARNMKEENSMKVPKDIVTAKNKIVKYLEKILVPELNEGTKKALIDDLNILFTE